MWKLTDAQVLVALDKAISPKSAYVAAEVDQMHLAHIRAGGKGFSPRRSLILSRLRSLERDGKIECRGGPDGYYGYTWRITDAGRDALAHSSTHSKGAM